MIEFLYKPIVWLDVVCAATAYLVATVIEAVLFCYMERK